MNKESKTEKKEIMKIINEIDTILFGYPQNLKLKKINSDNLLEGLYGAIVGFGGSSYAIFNGNIDEKYCLPAIGIGYGIGVLISYYIRGNKPTHYYGYEKAFLNLSRQDQLKVLELSKNLVEQYKKDITFDKNKKYVERYLYLDDENTMFNDFENNHPHFKIMPQEQIDEIHKRGNLTPIEKYNEINYCPGDGTPAWIHRCRKYSNCRDCVVSYVNERDEWKPLKFNAINIADFQVDEYGIPILGSHVKRLAKQNDKK